MGNICEEWRAIQGFEGLYEVSNYGRVKSLGGNRYKVVRILNGNVNTQGYRVFNLWKNGKPTLLSGHRLVAKAFIPNPQSKPLVDHINTVRTDNRVENLRWCTIKENNTNVNTIKKMSIGQKNSIYKRSRDVFGRFVKNRNKKG